MFDTAIIGTGAAGISAALTLKALGKNFFFLGSKQLSMKIRSAEKIRNYPGLPMASGEELQKAFLHQIEEMGIEITEKTVTGVFKMKDHYVLLCDREEFKARTVIVASGVESVKPIPGELEFVGRGVSYCATCDGFLYEGKRIAVLCTAKELEHEIRYLAHLAESVLLIPLYKNCAITEENVEILKKVPTGITGGFKADTLVFSDEVRKVDGIFMLKQAIAPTVLVGGIAAENGHIVVDREQKTNLPGCFAAGDCTGRPYQYAKAVGEGNVAAHSAVNYLAAVSVPADRAGETAVTG